MLSYIFRLVDDFKKEHGVQPNTLYLNRIHSEHLSSAFNSRYSLAEITDFLQMEMVINDEYMHPHVAWTQAAQRAAS